MDPVIGTVAAFIAAVLIGASGTHLVLDQREASASTPDTVSDTSSDSGKTTGKNAGSGSGRGGVGASGADGKQAGAGKRVENKAQ